MAQSELTKYQSGQTILESIVALFILGCVCAGILTGLRSADKIHFRALISMNASRIAENQFEMINKKALFNESIEDCTWVEISSGIQFQIERRIQIPDSLSYRDSIPPILEIQLNIETNQSKYRFRTLQGHSW